MSNNWKDCTTIEHEGLYNVEINVHTYKFRHRKVYTERMKKEWIDGLPKSDTAQMINVHCHLTSMGEAMFGSSKIKPDSIPDTLAAWRCGTCGSVHLKKLDADNCCC